MSEPTISDRLKNHLDFEHLQQKVKELPRKQRQLGDVLLERPEAFAFGTLNALEKLLGVSRITIIRFAKRLGFEGYGPLQEAVREVYLRHMGFQVPRSETDKLFMGRSLQKQTSLQHQANLDAALASLDMGQIDDICVLLLQARRIIVCGSGSAEVVATLLVRLLAHVGLHGELVSTTGVNEVIAASDLDERDVVVGISLWLTFTETMRMIRLSKRVGAKTVAIIGSRASPLLPAADHYLLAPAQGILPRFSLVAAVAIVEILIAELAAKRPEVAISIRDKLYDLYVEEELITSKGV